MLKGEIKKAMKKVIKIFIYIMLISTFAYWFLLGMFKYWMIKLETNYSKAHTVVQAELVWIYDEPKDYSNYKGLIKITDFIGYIVVNVQTGDHSYRPGTEHTLYIRKNTPFYIYTDADKTDKHLSGDIFSLKKGDIVDIWIGEGRDAKGSFMYATEIVAHPRN